MPLGCAFAFAAAALPVVHPSVRRFIIYMYTKCLLTWNASGDDDDVGALEGLGHTAVGWEVAIDLSDGRDVRQVGGNTWSVDDIVERKVVDERAGLEEEGQRLADTARCTCDDYKLASVSASVDFNITAATPMADVVMSGCLVIEAWNACPALTSFHFDVW